MKRKAGKVVKSGATKGKTRVKPTLKLKHPAPVTAQDSSNDRVASVSAINLLDWAHWRRRDYWSLDNACSLLLKKRPSAFLSGDQEVTKVWIVMRDAIVAGKLRAIQSGFTGNPVNKIPNWQVVPSEFLIVASEKGYGIPDELKSLLPKPETKSRNRVENGVLRILVAAEQVMQDKDARRECEDSNGRIVAKKMAAYLKANASDYWPDGAAPLALDTMERQLSRWLIERDRLAKYVAPVKTQHKAVSTAPIPRKTTPARQ